MEQRVSLQHWQKVQSGQGFFFGVFSSSSTITAPYCVAERCLGIRRYEHPLLIPENHQAFFELSPLHNALAEYRMADNVPDFK